MMKKKIKWIIWIEVIVFYMSVLNIISHAKGPTPYRVNTENSLLSASDMVPFSDMGMIGEKENSLYIFNNEEGAAVGYQGELQLDQLDGVHISFVVNCPSEYVGSMLYIDLYNYEENYDFPEQEHQVTLQEGMNQVSFDLSPGEEPPKTCSLRFFTTSLADYTLEEIQINSVEALPKVTTAMIACVAIIFVLIVITGLYAWCMFRRFETK